MSALLHSPAAERNAPAIFAALTPFLPVAGSILEIASGTGQHAAYFAPRIAPRQWCPSDIDPDYLASIRHYRAAGAGFAPPLILDMTDPAWPDRARGLADLGMIFCANMLHIAPWTVAEGLVAGAGRLLKAGGRLALYGPFWEDGVTPAPSNLAFDASLKHRDTRWGIRARGDVEALALSHRMRLEARTAMPANNLLLIFNAGNDAGR